MREYWWATTCGWPAHSVGTATVLLLPAQSPKSQRTPVNTILAKKVKKTCRPEESTGPGRTSVRSCSFGMPMESIQKHWLVLTTPFCDGADLTTPACAFSEPIVVAK